MGSAEGLHQPFLTIYINDPRPRADPEFPVGGGANPPGGRQHTILSNFPKKMHGSEKILVRWGGGGAQMRVGYLLDPPLKTS